MSVLPKWYSKELLGKALTSYFKNGNIQVLDFSSSTALQPGENYTTDFFKVVIVYTSGKGEKEKSIKVVIKSVHHEPKMVILAQEFEIFEVEMAMYLKILPEINNMLGNSESLSAKCIYSIEEPKSAIVLEDISALGFKNHPRQYGLDLSHCMLVAEKLANLHAASFVLHKEDPSLINTYKKGTYRNHPFIIHWLAVGFDALIKACERWPGYEKYARKLKLIQEQALDKTIASRKLNPEGFNVLNHGDCWINNFMFSYRSGGKVESLKFVDFQVIIYGSPVIDLIYFWITSASIEVRVQHFDTVFDHYHKCLTATLASLKCSLEKVPSEEQLKEEFNSRAFSGLASAVTVLPLVAATSRDDASFENLFGSDEEGSFRRDAYNNDRYRKHMEYLLPLFDALGILD